MNNVTVDHNTIHGVGQGNGSSRDWCGVGIETLLGRRATTTRINFTITNNNIYWCSNPTNNFVNGGLVKNNYAHDFANSSTGSHYEAMQLESYVENGNLLTIQDNTFLNQHTDQTAAIILSNDASACGAENNRVITHNLLAGGGYTFYGVWRRGAPAVDEHHVHEQPLQPDLRSDGGGYGPVTYWKSGGGNVWSGNVWDDTRRSVKP